MNLLVLLLGLMLIMLGIIIKDIRALFKTSRKLQERKEVKLDIDYAGFVILKPVVIY